MLDDFEYYLLRKRGVTKIPLAYLVRARSVSWPNSTNDKDLRTPTHDQELIRRAKHEGVNISDGQCRIVANYPQQHTRDECVELGLALRQEP